MCYINLARQFFVDLTVVPIVFGFHRQLVAAFESQDEKNAAQIMRQMLIHGAEKLNKADSSQLIADSPNDGIRFRLSMDRKYHKKLKENEK
jgi:hypothetical protein